MHSRLYSSELVILRYTPRLDTNHIGTKVCKNHTIIKFIPMRSNGTRNFYDLFDALSIIILLGLSTLKYPLRLVDAAYAKYSFPYLQPLLKSWHMMDPDTQFSIDDLAQHKARDDLWIAVHGKGIANKICHFSLTSF